LQPFIATEQQASGFVFKFALAKMSLM